MKKKLLLGILIILTLNIFAQSDYFNYQSIIRNNNGELITNQDVNFRITILEGSETGTDVYNENHNVTSNSYGQCNLEIGNGTNQSNDFGLIDWGSNDYFLKIEIDESGGTSYKEMGIIQLLSVPYSLYSDKAAKSIKADTANVAKRLEDDIIYVTDTDTLFAVKDRNGNVVFAVYPDGAVVYVNETTKAKVGGFAVSGRNPSKSTEETYMVVTADSTRIYVNQPQSKAKVGGFAVSGRNPSKSIEEEYLVVTADSTRIYVNQEATKGKVGGFAVSGRNPSKGNVDNFLDITPENYFIGHESGQKTLDSPDFGNYNVFLGYQTGRENETGSRNIFIGYQTAKDNTHGMSNVYIGSQSGFNNTLGYDNVFIGSSSGYTNTEGINNVFLGSQSGYSNIDGDDNVFVGFETGYNNTTGIMNTFIGNKAGRANKSGNDNIFIGELAGYHNVDGSENIFIGKRVGIFVESAVENTLIGSYSGQQVTTGTQNTFLGHQTGLGITKGYKNTLIGALAVNKDSTGSENVAVGYNAGGWSYGNSNIYIGVAAGMNVEGDSSVYIGYNAGFNATGSQKLYIENSSMPNPLIYGDFKEDKVVINGSINYGSASGTNTYTAEVSSIAMYIEGMAFYIKFSNTNTTVSTIKINDLDEKSIILPSGSELSGGEINAGGIHLLIYDGVNFQLMTL